MSNIEQVSAAWHIYLSSTDTSELESRYEIMKKISEDRVSEKYYPDVVRKALINSLRIKAKQLMLYYLGNFTDVGGRGIEKDTSEIQSFVQEALTVAESKGLTKTIELLKRIDFFVQTVGRVVDEISAVLSNARDQNGAFICPKEDAIAISEKINDNITNLTLLSQDPVFGPEEVQGVDCWTVVIDELNKWYGNVMSYIESVDRAETVKRLEKVLKEFVSYQDEEIQYDFSPNEDDNLLANVIVLRSPFEKEARFCVYSEAQSKGYETAYIDASSDRFDHTTMKMVFVGLYSKNPKTYCLISGLTKQVDDQKRMRIYAEILQNSIEKNRIYILDDGIKESIFGGIKKCVGNVGDKSLLDVARCYLRMPMYDEVCKTFIESGMISDTEQDKNKIRALAFMGYIGFNEAYNRAKRGNNGWFEEAKSYSERCKSKANEYIEELLDLVQLIDNRWRVDEYVKEVDNTRQEFNYDAINDIDINIIKRIVNSNASLYSKVAAAVNYSILCGQDKTVWKELSLEEKSSRMTTATRLVFQLLELDTVPTVKVMAKDEFPSEKAGGLCCNGGESILYKESCCDNLTWVLETICHESFHAFQHYLISHKWKPWHFAEFGITRNRINEWLTNRSNKGYHHSIEENYEAYRVQIFEADAFAFEKDCFEMGKDILPEILN